MQFVLVLTISLPYWAIYIMEYRKRQRGQQKMDERNRRIREDGYEPVHTKYSTIKEQLRQAVDRAVEMTKDEQDFIRIMREQFGIAVRFSRGVISYKHPDREKTIRGRMLGRIYEREQIAERIAGFQQQEEEQRRPEFQGMPRIFFIHSELRLVVDLQTCVKAQQSRAYARQVALSNLQEMARTIAYIQEHGIGTVDKLAEAADQAEAQYKQASADLRKTQNALTAINERIHYTCKRCASVPSPAAPPASRISVRGRVQTSIPACRTGKQNIRGSIHPDTHSCPCASSPFSGQNTSRSNSHLQAAIIRQSFMVNTRASRDPRPPPRL